MVSINSSDTQYGSFATFRSGTSFGIDLFREIHVEF